MILKYLYDCNLWLSRLYFLLWKAHNYYQMKNLMSLKNLADLKMSTYIEHAFPLFVCIQDKWLPTNTIIRRTTTNNIDNLLSHNYKRNLHLFLI